MKSPHKFSFCVRFNTIKKERIYTLSPFFTYLARRRTTRPRVVRNLNEQGEKCRFTQKNSRSRNVLLPRVELGAVRAVQLRNRRRRDDRRHRCGCAHSVFRVGKPERKGGIDEETKEEKRVNQTKHAGSAVSIGRFDRRCGGAVVQTDRVALFPAILSKSVLAKETDDARPKGAKKKAREKTDETNARQRQEIVSDRRTRNTGIQSLRFRGKCDYRERRSIRRERIRSELERVK